MKRTPHLFHLAALLIIAALFTSCTMFAPEPTSTPTLTATATQTASPTVTLTPTVTSTPTKQPTPTITNTPTPTPDPLAEILTDLDVLASYYGDDVVIEVQDEPLLVPYYVPQFSVAVPPMANFTSTMDLSETGQTRIEGTFYDSDLNFTISSIPYAEDMIPPPEDMAAIMIETMQTRVITNADLIHDEYEILDINKGAVFVIMVFEFEDYYLLIEELSLVLDYSFELDIYVLYNFANKYESLEALEADSENLKAEILNLHDNFTIMKSYFEMAHHTRPLEIFSGLCPTSTDPTYGFTLENPIRMVNPVSDDFLENAFNGPTLADNYFHTLLYNGQPVHWERQGSTDNAESIIDIYQITGPTITTPITLYVDQYTAQPYLVPAGFGCNGILYPDHYLSYEPLTEE